MKPAVTNRQISYKHCKRGTSSTAALATLQKGRRSGNSEAPLSVMSIIGTRM